MEPIEEVISVVLYAFCRSWLLTNGCSFLSRSTASLKLFKSLSRHKHLKASAGPCEIEMVRRHVHVRAKFDIALRIAS